MITYESQPYPPEAPVAVHQNGKWICGTCNKNKNNGKEPYSWCEKCLTNHHLFCLELVSNPQDQLVCPACITGVL